MATFPNYKPVYPASKQSEPRIRTTSFGDGYEQRLRFGLNTNPKVWPLTFIVDDAAAIEIEAFFDARAIDGQSFDWTPPDSSTSYKWFCKSWSKEIFDYGANRIQATFEQKFEP
jgi:phage-related protein